jgi:PhnB protein
MTYMSEDASKASRFQPNGWPTVIPRMFTPDVAGVVGFLKSVFDADGDMPAGAPAVVRIGDSVIMVSDGGGAREFLPTFLYVYVDNTDRVCQRAVEAGALIIEHPADMPYGDRRAVLRDAWGNTWQIATHGPAQKASA